MANTYSQIYIQIVFAVSGRQNLIDPRFREEIHKYITGIVGKRGQKLLAVFSMPDHVHILVAIQPSVSISDMVRDIKAGTSNFINKQGWLRGHFNWQEGFGAFSYSRSQIDKACKYILDQEERHRKRTFKNEYIGLLRKFEIEYDERYLFDWHE